VKARRVAFVVAAYVALNVAFYVWNPLQSKWHYAVREPVPIALEAPGDAALSVPQILEILDEIDLAYGGRSPTDFEALVDKAKSAAAIVMLPATMAIVMVSFVEYMGPPTKAQSAFTLSVKARYNHLATRAVALGHRSERRLFVIEPTLGKTPGQSLSEIAPASR
jgi:hypothetical protein